MHILQLCKKFPYPLKDGEAIAIMNLTRSLNKNGAQLHILCMNTQKHYFDIKKLPASIRSLGQFCAVDVDTQIKFFNAVSSWNSEIPYIVKRFVHRDFKLGIINLLKKKKFDVVHCEGIFLAPYLETIRKHCDAKVSLRSHNVESDIWARLAENHKPGLKKLYLNHTVKALRKYEFEQLEKFDMIVPISEVDEKIFRESGCSKPMCTIPSGYDFVNEQVDRPNNAKDICFIGGMDWLPNQEGVKWFIDQVLPLILDKKPHLVFHIAGRNTPEWLHSLNSSHVKVHGEVDDAFSFIKGHRIMVVPLLSGSGMRIKIVEALALKTAVVSTSVGAEGISYKNGKHLLLADDPGEFAKSIIMCMNDNKFTSDMIENGFNFVQQNLNNEVLGKKLLNFYSEIS